MASKVAGSGWGSSRWGQESIARWGCQSQIKEDIYRTLHAGLARDLASRDGRILKSEAAPSGVREVRMKSGAANGPDDVRLMPAIKMQRDLEGALTGRGRAPLVALA